MSLKWRTILTVLFLLGFCEMLVSTPSFDPGWVPRWLGVPVVLTGFFTVLFFGFIGNLVVAIALPWLLWRGMGWPYWQATLIALPFWITGYRLAPKPW